jgi:Zn-finger protein
MTIKIGGLGQEISCYCPVCSEKMTHWAIASKSIRYEWKCEPCELSLKSDRDGYAHLLTEMAYYA